MKLRTVIILIVMALLMSCAKTAVYQSSEEKLAKADEFYAKKKVCPRRRTLSGRIF